ncbi:MAG: LCP family protein [Lachnospiraceae bacterium]|nr:LCP family protein [Lachnospiraceae bacterium]
MKKIRLFVCGLLIILCCVMIIFCWKIVNKEEETMAETIGNQVQETNTINYQGKKYYPRQNQKLILYMGIDQKGVFDSESRQEDVAPVSIMVIAVNEEEETFSILQLNRNTLADIVLADQNISRQKEFEAGPILEAYSYGKDVKDQCLNIEETISKYLTGIEIDNYLLFGTDALRMSNDMAGGSRVEIQDDFSSRDPYLKKDKKITLLGDHVLAYLKILPGEDTIMRRGPLRRQKEVFECFTENLRKKTEENNGFPLELFSSIADYIQTDCSNERLADIFGSIADYELEENLILKGTKEKVEDQDVYVVEEDDRMETCIRMFYEEKR